MKSLTHPLRKMAAKKVDRKAVDSFIAVEKMILYEEDPTRFEVPIGRAPMRRAPKDYADEVGRLAVEKMDICGIPDVIYDSEATKMASQKCHHVGVGSGLAVNRMAGKLTLVFNRRQET